MNRTRLTLAAVTGIAAIFTMTGMAVATLRAPSIPAAIPAATAVPEPTDTTWPLNLPPAADPTPTTQPPPGTPAPYVQPFADQPDTKDLAPRPSPKTPVKMPAFADGCNHAYGTRNQCVPLEFPPGTTDKCTWLKSHGFKKLTVQGKDTHLLDRNANHTACDG
ncbi:hypothetical protein GCM10010435_95470 [Winogradskya consettensis]|uniref:Uncharacterized protein n=1 Tax=Winogradskya consettensis TaxID=113560 RepID=A0A919T3P8_9ACTN|nr:hypothetical protein [Actinoplanes consettensis]GIM83736.1 hypothetical protein Aco04nite_88030 [Actinoplanes consettensis]